MLNDEEKKKILDSYIKGEGSIQGIANYYRCTVEDVLEIIGQQELTHVTIQGDLIDQDEAGNAPVNPPTTHKVKFDAS